jgi:predicted MPP superfamily phosphohydrolase
MRRLWISYAAVYLVLHAYFMRVIHLAYPGETGLLLAGVALCLVMLVVLLLSRVLESMAQFELARGFSFVGTPWLVLLTWFCVLAGIMDAWNLGLNELSESRPGVAELLLPVRPTVGIIALIVSLAGLWSLIEAYRVRLKKVTFRTSRVSEPVRILQISDLHLNLLAGERRLKRIVRLIQKADPDMIVSTGDMVDGQVPRIERFAQEMARMNPRLGKYAVLGNHDFYSGLPASLWFHEAAGFKVIRGECLTIEPGLRLVGVDDPVGNRMGQRCWSNEVNILPPRSADAVTILLKHRPKVSKAALGRFDLQLSGHTHGGQISADRVALMGYRMRSGMNHLGDGTAAYVSRGTGTWGAPMRLFSPPEVALIQIEPCGEG